MSPKDMLLKIITLWSESTHPILRAENTHIGLAMCVPTMYFGANHVLFPHNNWQRKHMVGEPALSSWIGAGESPGFPAGGDLGDYAKGVHEEKPPNLLAARSWYPRGPSFPSIVCVFSVMLLSAWSHSVVHLSWCQPASLWLQCCSMSWS